MNFNITTTFFLTTKMIGQLFLYKKLTQDANIRTLNHTTKEAQFCNHVKSIFNHSELSLWPCKILAMWCTSSWIGHSQLSLFVYWHIFKELKAFLFYDFKERNLEGGCQSSLLWQLAEIWEVQSSDPWPMGKPLTPRLALISHLMMSLSVRKVFKLINH